MLYYYFTNRQIVELWKRTHILTYVLLKNNFNMFWLFDLNIGVLYVCYNVQQV